MPRMSAAVMEPTTVYPVDEFRGPGPLPNHLLFKDEPGVPGSRL